MAPSVLPVAGSPKIIGTPYSGTHTLGNWESDNAVDLAVPVGTPVYAVEAGTIGPQFGALAEGGGRFAGLRLHLNASSGDSFYYAHLSSFAAGIRPGVTVKAGELLGYSGQANGVAHLHFATSTNLNPLTIVQGLPGAVADVLSASAAGGGSSAGTDAAAAADAGLPIGCATAVVGAFTVVGVVGLAVELLAGRLS